MNTDDFCSYCGTELEWQIDGDIDDEGKQVGGWVSFCPNISEIEDDPDLGYEEAIGEMSKHDGYD